MGWGARAARVPGRSGLLTLTVIATIAVAGTTAGGPNAAPAKAKQPASKKKPPGAKQRPPGAKPKPGRGRSRKRRLPQEFFGVQSFEPMTQGEFAALRSARVGTSRAAIYWRATEPVQGARNWVLADYQVGSAARHGIRVLPVLYGMARWAGSHPAQPPIFTVTALAGWRAFVADAVRRYGPGGEFWRSNPELPYLPLRRWQVWNEPSNTYAWAGAPDGRQYASLVRETAGAIRLVDPRAKVLLAGILPNFDDPHGIPLPVFLRQIYAVRGIKRSFDGVAVHPYAIYPRRSVEAVERARKVMDRRGDRKASLWVTEVGWSTGGTQGERPIITSLDGQARNLTKTYRELLERRRALRLKQIVWFAMRDFSIGGLDLWPMQMGLFQANKVAKPAWHALTRFTRGQAGAIVEPPAAPAPPPSPEPEPCFLVFVC